MAIQQSDAIMPHDTPDTHLTLFEDLGHMVADSAYIHVMHPVDTRNFSSTFQRARELLVKQFTDFHDSKNYRTAVVRSLTLRHHVITVPVNVIAAGQPWVQHTKWDTLEIPKKLFANEIKRRNDIQRLFSEDDEVRSVIEAQLNSSLMDLQDAHESIAKDAENFMFSINNHQYYILALAAVASILFIILCICMCCRYCTAPTPAYVPAPTAFQTAAA
jgi:hypothetical protein